jgi:hypothetical protein
VRSRWRPEQLLVPSQRPFVANQVHLVTWTCIQQPCVLRAVALPPTRASTPMCQPSPGRSGRQHPCHATHPPARTRREVDSTKASRSLVSLPVMRLPGSGLTSSGSAVVRDQARLSGAGRVWVRYFGLHREMDSDDEGHEWSPVS